MVQETKNTHQKTTQNELINIVGEYLREKLLVPLQTSTYYSIMADEVTDNHANWEILSLCLIFLDLRQKPTIKEVFLDFLHLERATGEKIAAGILKILEKRGLDTSNMRGQSYDGAPAMAGGENGTQAFILKKQPKTVYAHCRSHVLNLSIAASCRIQEIRNLIDSINELFNFLTTPQNGRGIWRMYFKHLLQVLMSQS